jgi:hypothetical protein
MFVNKSSKKLHEDIKINSNKFLNQFLRESRNKIIWKIYKEETIFISAFNAENFMKIR